MTDGEYHIDVTINGITALDILAQETSLPKSKLKLAMERGAVWLEKNDSTKRLRRGKKIVAAGEQLHLYFNETILRAEPLAPSLVDDQNEYTIWYKPYGVYCQGTKWADHFTLNRWIETHHSRASWIVHRLDRATTGLIIIGHRKKSTAALAALFQAREIEKKYQAIVYGSFPNNKTLAIDTPLDNKSACSHVTLNAYDAVSDCSRVDVKIDSGRKHQIRRHLSAAGFPIAGDRLYGRQKESNESRPANDQQNLQLCCTSLRFNCPLTGENRHYRLDNQLPFKNQ